jgi:hypothetical protein
MQPSTSASRLSLIIRADPSSVAKISGTFNFIETITFSSSCIIPGRFTSLHSLLADIIQQCAYELITCVFAASALPQGRTFANSHPIQLHLFQQLLREPALLLRRQGIYIWDQFEPLYSITSLLKGQMANSSCG